MISLEVLYDILSNKEIIRKVTDLAYFTDSVANSLSIKPSDFIVRFLKAIDIKQYKDVHSISNKVSSMSVEQFVKCFEKEFVSEMVLSRIGDGYES